MISLYKVNMPEEAGQMVQETLYSGMLTEGVKVVEFEELLGKYLGVEYVLSLNSCTSALTLALRLANVGPGAEVISTPLTNPATNVSILNLGGKVVWADIDPATGNIDVNSIKDRISDRTKAVMCVHWGGLPCDLEEINAVAHRHGAKVIEDAAHAFGATCHGQMIGTHSDFVCFSFQAIKHITTGGDGGALICRSEEDYLRGRKLKWFGVDRYDERYKKFRLSYDINEPGFKFHMNNLNATIGIAQMKHASEVVSRFVENGKWYDAAFADLGIPSVTPLRTYPDSDRTSSYWIYTFLAENTKELMEYLESNGVMASTVIQRNDVYSAFKASATTLSGVDTFTSQMVCIPSGWWVSKHDRSHIVDLIRRFYDQ